MKFTTVMFITFAIFVMSSPSPIKGRATAVGGFKEVAQSCVITELMPCLPAITAGGPPSEECCDKMNEQKPCLCGYIKNPALSTYVSSPNSLKVLKACKIPIPTC
ncbi:Non-specific lipid-transfer protein 2 [Cardamine amara subsp. amara]|uniref:Non-specific lipid-transfer protein 2 n=1 Tax=Cardamine amara subsp. amara TaxID=228776 RepID=A0ABD1B8E5_CARAN